MTNLTDLQLERYARHVILDEVGATGLAGRLAGAAFTVRAVEQRPHTERPRAPFITSTLQQAASSKLRRFCPSTATAAATWAPAPSQPYANARLAPSGTAT